MKKKSLGVFELVGGGGEVNFLRNLVFPNVFYMVP